MKRLVIKWILIVIFGSVLASVSNNGMIYGSNQAMVLISLLGAMMDEMYAPLAEAFKIPVNFLSVMIMAFVTDLIVILLAFALAKGGSISFNYAVIFALICALIGRVMDILIKPSVPDQQK